MRRFRCNLYLHCKLIHETATEAVCVVLHCMGIIPIFGYNLTFWALGPTLKSEFVAITGTPASVCRIRQSVNSGLIIIYQNNNWID